MKNATPGQPRLRNTGSVKRLKKCGIRDDVTCAGAKVSVWEDI